MKVFKKCCGCVQLLNGLIAIGIIEILLASILGIFMASEAGTAKYFILLSIICTVLMIYGAIKVKTGLFLFIFELKNICFFLLCVEKSKLSHSIFDLPFDRMYVRCIYFSSSHI